MILVTALVISALSHVDVVSAASESSGGSIFETGGKYIEDSPALIQTTMFFVLAVAVCAEWVIKWLKKSIHTAFQQIIASVLNEVMILGVIRYWLVSIPIYFLIEYII